MHSFIFNLKQNSSKIPKETRNFKLVNFTLLSHGNYSSFIVHGKVEFWQLPRLSDFGCKIPV